MSKKLNQQEIDIGKEVKEKRKSAGLTQKDLAIHLGVSVQQIQKYESGKNRISAAKLKSIEKLINFNMKSAYSLRVKNDDFYLASSNKDKQQFLILLDKLSDYQREALFLFINAMLIPKT